VVEWWSIEDSFYPSITPLLHYSITPLLQLLLHFYFVTVEIFCCVCFSDSALSISSNSRVVTELSGAEVFVIIAIHLYFSCSYEIEYLYNSFLIFSLTNTIISIYVKKNSHIQLGTPLPKGARGIALSP
jgi:hypothetical protein